MTDIGSVYVPHACGTLLGGAHPPWIAEDPAASPGRGQPVFRAWPPAATWLSRWLDHSQTDLVVAAVEATTHAGRDGRTLVDFERSQLLEPHRQLVNVGARGPHPRALRACFHAASNDAKKRAFARQVAGPTVRQPEQADLAYRVAFAHGYQLAYSNAGRAVEALASDTLAELRLRHTGVDQPVEPPLRQWLGQVPAWPPESEPTIDGLAAGTSEYEVRPIVAQGWARGLALGGADGALRASRAFQAAIIAIPGDAVLLATMYDTVHDALAMTIPAWADRRLANQATGASPMPVMRHGPAAPYGFSQAAVAFPAAPDPGRSKAPGVEHTAPPTRTAAMPRSAPPVPPQQP